MRHIIFVSKNKTANELRIRDWSSDVCSSDLPAHSTLAAFYQRMAQHSCAGHAKGMPHRDGPAIDVAFFGVDPEMVAAVKALAGKCFVQFPQANVGHRQAGAVEQIGSAHV